MARPLDELESQTHFPALDGLRGVAMLVVLITHLPDQSFPDWFDRMARNIGYGALDSFFVLSGFLITRILLAERAAGRPMARFFVRRLLRVFPAFWVVVACVQLWEPNWDNLLAFLYVINYTLPFHVYPYALGHTWSLAVEEQFYLTWPWLVRGLTLERSRWVLTRVMLPGSVLLAFILLGFAGSLPVKAILHMWTPFRTMSVGLGCLMAYHEAVVRSDAGVGWQRAAFAASLGLAAAGWLLVPLKPVLHMMAYALLSSGFVLTLVVPRFQTAQAFCSLAPLRYVGKISYGLYLYHLPIYFALGFREGYVPKWKMALAIGLAFAAATTSWTVLEEPVMRLKRHFR